MSSQRPGFRFSNDDLVGYAQPDPSKSYWLQAFMAPPGPCPQVICSGGQVFVQDAVLDALTSGGWSCGWAGVRYRGRFYVLVTKSMLRYLSEHPNFCGTGDRTDDDRIRTDAAHDFWVDLAEVI